MHEYRGARLRPWEVWVITLDKSRIPKHVAIIMDGNRRWAVERKLPTFAGHKKVVSEVIEELIERAGELGIPYITFWAWSADNWKRPGKEVAGVMRLFRWALKERADRMIKKGARLRVIGDTSKFDEDIQKGIGQMIKASEKNDKINVTYALNYGGRDELLRSFRKILKEIPNSKFQIPNVSAEDVEKHLDTVGMPEPDLIIRTGGTKRLSGFMLWQSEYSELYFTDVLMPDFGTGELDKAIEDYMRRERRFGGGQADEYKKS